MTCRRLEQTGSWAEHTQFEQTETEKLASSQGGIQIPGRQLPQKAKWGKRKRHFDATSRNMETKF